MAEKVRVGVVGCGAISGQYLANAPKFPIIQIVALADLIRERCENRAREFGLEGVKICTTEQMMKDDSIEVILNLTWPKAHVPVGLQTIKAGKHHFSEKPMGIHLKEGKKLYAAAQEKGVRLGCAPDTFLGSGIQTARKVIDDGLIGRPVAFTAFMMNSGVETWHPNPPFYYEPGGGPMLDMGPYYLTALLNFFGPIKRVSGFASIAIPDRLITHKDKDGNPGPLYGQKITVTTPDHIAGTIEFENGVIGTIVTSFATRFANYDGQQPITVYGTLGAMKVPDPNCFDGPVHIRLESDAEWREVPSAFLKGYGRAVGLADLCHAIRSGRKHRASGEQAFAVLEAMQGFLDSSAKGKAISPVTRYERPDPMPIGLPFGTLND
jgi:predicted dehydrogenase